MRISQELYVIENCDVRPGFAILPQSFLNRLLEEGITKFDELPQIYRIVDRLEKWDDKKSVIWVGVDHYGTTAEFNGAISLNPADLAYLNASRGDRVQVDLVNVSSAEHIEIEWWLDTNVIPADCIREVLEEEFKKRVVVKVGQIITNDHLIARVVQVNNGKDLVAYVVRVEPKIDLKLLCIPANSEPTE